MNTIVSAANILVQYLLFGKFFHGLSIIIYLSIRFLFFLVPILYEGTVTLYKIVLRWRILVN